MSSSFSKFYKTWFVKLHDLVEQLKTAPKPSRSADDDKTFSSLVVKAMSHFDEYFIMKKLVAESDVLSFFPSPWATPLENSMQWVAGFRPTILFHLVYTESSIMFESHIFDILRGLRTGDLGDLSPTQLNLVSELQCETVREENAITDEFSEWQHGASDMVKLRCNIEAEIRRLVIVVEKADDLRLRTIKTLADMLTPQQGVEFFLAAAELLFGIRSWGLIQEGQRGRNQR